MLSPELLKRIEAVRIKSRRAVDAVMAGQYRSVFRGTGIEFEEVREYAPGDEVKSIDWKVTARMGRPFVKRFREERELSIMLLVDMSASGRFGTADDLKREAAVPAKHLLVHVERPSIVLDGLDGTARRDAADDGHLHAAARHALTSFDDERPRAQFAALQESFPLQFLQQVEDA